MNKKIIIIIAAIIIFAIVIFGLIFIYSHFPSKNNSKTIDWTKYTNDQLMAMANPNWNNEAMFFKGIEGNYLIIDQGTAPDPRGLIIYDLEAKKQVLSDRYSQPLDITDKNISYWNPTNQKVTADNCPESVKWTSEGLGAEIEVHVSFDLLNLAKKDLGQTRCHVTQ